MNRKRLTQIFPFLLPVRVIQRKIFFYAHMRFDGHSYAKNSAAAYLPFKLFEANCGLYNSKTGFDMVYQENKVFNLKLAAKSLDGLLIEPGETFSFWQAVRNADKHTPYRDGLTVANGKLITAQGGGLCQMSNLLFWIFLHSPLTIIERHTHKVQTFPSLHANEPEGVDATVNEGWLDLKVKNETDLTFQIGIGFDDNNILGSLYVEQDMHRIYEIEGNDHSFFSESGKTFESISILRRQMIRDSRTIISEELLYTNICEIGYQLSDFYNESIGSNY